MLTVIKTYLIPRAGERAMLLAIDVNRLEGDVVCSGAVKLGVISHQEFWSGKRFAVGFLKKTR